MNKLNQRGALISFNTEKNFYEVQRIDDIDQFKEDVGWDGYVPKLISDDKAKAVAKNLGIEFLDEENPYKVGKYFNHKGDSFEVQYDQYGSEGRNLGELFDWLGDEADIIQANELYQFCCIDDCGNIFDFTNEDEYVLAKRGIIELFYTGETIEDYKEKNPDFYNWYWGIK